VPIVSGDPPAEIVDGYLKLLPAIVAPPAVLLVETFAANTTLPMASKVVLVIAPVCPLRDVTPPPDALTVTAPVPPLIVIPVPATIEVTPVLVTVGVFPPATEMPVPAETEVTADVVCVLASLNVSVVLLIDTGIIDS
jgi:hypothetical protein